MTVKILATSLVFTSFAIATAHAQTPVRIDQFDAWSAYSYKSGDSVSCYILSTPVTQQPSNVDHGDNFFIVAHPSAGDTYVPEAAVGYDLKQGGPMTAMIGDKTYVMFTKDRHGWLQDEAQQPAMIQAMKSGAKLELHATSKRGTATSYSYSLSGMTAALKRISACK